MNSNDRFVLRSWWNILLKSGMFLFSLIIVSASISGVSRAVTYEAEDIPWSGYWWPFQKGGLSTGLDYRGHPSPLEKYELYVNNNINGPSIGWYEHHYYQRDAVNWGGLCPSWARAAAYENYEILPSSVDNMVFRVGDKKGLLVLCHDDDFYRTGDGRRPEQFHEWLLQYIRDEKRPFTADLSTGEQIWYYPIYRYDMTTVGGIPKQTVYVTIYYAADDVPPDTIGTIEKSREYSYTLDLDASGAITGGAWTGTSVDNHPETMKIPITAKARCPYLDCDEIRRIAQTRDDFLETEENSPQPIDPGTYHLILLDSDEYILRGSPGDEFYVEVVKEEGSAEDMNLRIFDTSDDSLVENVVLNRLNPSFSCRLTQTTEAPYSLSVLQLDNYETDPNIYTLVMDRIPAFRQQIPFLPKNGEWSGFALTNTGDQVVENAILVACNLDGSPQQTIYGPATIPVNGKNIVESRDLPWRAHESSSLTSLKLLSDEKIDMLNLFSKPGWGMGGFGCEDDNGNHIVIPDTFYSFFGNGPYMKGAVINETFYDVPVEVRVFSGEGEQLDIFEDTIGPGANLNITAGSSPFSRVVDGGWVDIVSQNGRKLSGYQYTRDLSGKKNDINTLMALPVFKKVKYVPHITAVATANQWRTETTVINPHDKANQLVFHLSRAGENLDEDIVVELAPYEKQVLDLTDAFGRMPGDALYHSMLEIRGDDAFVGYYSYVSEASDMKDQAAFPLLDDRSFKHELVLPHACAKTSHWWTGVGICNPNAYPVAVKAEPYDADGEIMEDMIAFIRIDPGAYQVFNLRSMFSGPGDISFIRFYPADDAEALIGGFYLFGIGNVTSLSGANM